MMRRLWAVLFVCALFVPAFSGCARITMPPLADYTVETVTEYRTENENSLVLMYPAVAGYADRETETKVNALLSEYAYAMYLHEDGITSGGYDYVATDVEITLLADGFLSGYIGGVITADATGYTAYFSYTFNCDIENGRLYRTEELISDYPRLKKLFLADRFSQHFGYPELKSQVSLADMISQYKTEYGILPDIYFTENGVGILIDVIPLLDGYAGFTLPLSRAIKCMNTDNPLIRLYMGEN